MWSWLYRREILLLATNQQQLFFKMISPFRCLEFFFNYHELLNGFNVYQSLIVVFRVIFLESCRDFTTRTVMINKFFYLWWRISNEKKNFMTNINLLMISIMIIINWSLSSRQNLITIELDYNLCRLFVWIVVRS